MVDEQEHKHFNEEKLVSDIREYGWAVLMFQATDYLPSFAYTVGLWKSYGHPELISFGLNIITLQLILNDAGAIVKAGQKLETNKNYDAFFEKGSSQFIPVDTRNMPDYFGNAINFYDTKDFPALQLVWADRNNKFPWDKDYEEEFKWRQPLLDRNADFKFREEKNLGVFTTRQWLDLKQPILHVVHDEDGDWQFLTGDQFPEDIKLVALEQMTLRDNTLNEVFDLNYGESAEREFIGDAWIRFRDDITENDL